MANESRLEPEVISFDAGIKSDSAGDSEDFADMVNLMPPPDGSAGVIPRLPMVNLETWTTAGTVALVQKDPTQDASGASISNGPMIAIRTAGNNPVALFPFFDSVDSMVEFEDTTSEYYRPA